MSVLLLQRDSVYFTVQVGLCLTHKAENVIFLFPGLCSSSFHVILEPGVLHFILVQIYQFGLATDTFCLLFLS